MEKRVSAFALSVLSFGALANPGTATKESSDKLQTQIVHQVGVFVHVADQCSEYFKASGDTEKSEALILFKSKALSKMAPGFSDSEAYKQGYESGKALMDGEDKQDMCEAMYRSVTGELKLKIEENS